MLTEKDLLVRKRASLFEYHVERHVFSIFFILARIYEHAWRMLWELGGIKSETELLNNSAEEQEKGFKCVGIRMWGFKPACD